MEDMNFMVPSPGPTNLPTEITSLPIVDEGPRLCPVCSSEARFFFINFNEKMLMCENTECDFPFGYEDLQFIKLDTDESVSDALLSRNRTPRSSCSSSMISSSAWSEIDKMNRIYELEESTLNESHKLTPIPVTTKNKKSIKKTKTQIKKNVEDIKDLNMELLEVETPQSILLNEKWINNLKNLQGQSGVQLLKPQELKRVHQEKKQEIKIDIDTDKTSNMSSIKIQLASTSNT